MTHKNLLHSDAFRFLKDQHTAVIATSFENQPHATVVYYDVDDDFNIYYLTKQNTQKNIQTAFNPRIAMVIGTGPEHCTVQIRGRAYILLQEEKVEAMNRMILRYTKIGVSQLPIQTMEGLRT